MASRIELDNFLRTFGKKVYFQPPESIKLEYPCFVYKRTNGRSTYSNNNPYTFINSYQITYITKDPDAEIEENGQNFVDKFSLSMPSIRHSNHFVSSGLNHDVFEVYY